ncbi:rhodanese-like domain-containing protein [Allosalinactinospora lopnorensis]|uniref:rhodanese-like domain-containing protein n=1 Tax=Allosalinactinospora lopnorensis TaxID=1352348 RepID=UPI000623CEE7|nr:rhodanese-like domain-containing protein [Allosalinactinospora lopnorensis]
MDHAEAVGMDAARVRALQEADPRVRLIDVRTPREFAAAHIPGSSNVPIELLREHRRELSAEHADPVVLVCRSGTRAEQARQLLAASGLGRIHVLQGGISDWESAGAPLKRGRGTWAMERQVRLAAGAIVLLTVVASLAFAPLKWIAAFVGAGLIFAAVTDTCAMARVLSLLPWNRVRQCDAPATLSALTEPAPTART